MCFFEIIYCKKSYIYAEMEVITFAHENVIGKTMVAFTQKASSVEGHVSKREKNPAHMLNAFISSVYLPRALLCYIYAGCCMVTYGHFQKAQS